MAADVTAAAGDVVVLFALRSEADPFVTALARGPGRWPCVPLVTGVGQAAAARGAGAACGLPARLVVAAGFCGALVPSLRVGDVVTSPRILTVDHLVADPAEKRRLAGLHGADAVDMESAAVADVCAARGVPFLAVRAVSDTADTALSPELVRLVSGGSVSVWRAVRALARRPALLGEFRRLARDTRLAARNLADALLAVLARPGVL